MTQKRKEIARRFPETIAIKKNLYSIEGKKATEKYQAEMMLSELESITAPIIDRVDAGDKFSVRDKYYVSLFASLLKVRVPNFERWISDLNDAVGKQFLKARYASEQELRKHLQSWVANRWMIRTSPVACSTLSIRRITVSTHPKTGALE